MKNSKMSNNSLYTILLKLCKKYNPGGTWFKSKDPYNRFENMVNKLRNFVNKNPRLRSKYAKLFKKDISEAAKIYKIYTTEKFRKEREKAEGLRVRKEKS